jgi:dephospho-CoA kinase
MIKIGLTGIMGSGKSTVAALLRKRGYEIIDLDALARDSLNWKETQDDIRNNFGKDYIINDKVDVERLRLLVFTKSEELKRLEKIVHPRVHQEVVRRLVELEKEGRSAVVLDHPLLFETGFQDKVDVTVVVTTDMETIGERLKGRGVDTDDMKRRLAFQIPLGKKEQMADYVIDNNGTEDRLREQVDSLIEKITKLEVTQHASK